jgi:aminoglycoside phosphotransferase (APT) family kinase protein
LLKNCLEHLLPPDSKDVSVHDIRKLTEQGATALVYSFFLTYLSADLRQRKDFVLKIYNEEYEKGGSAEFATLKILKEHNLPVPTPYHFEIDNRIMGKPFMIMEKIVGKSGQCYLTNKINSQNIVAKMAKTLVEIHKIDPSGIQGVAFLRERYVGDLRRQLAAIFFIKNYCMSFLGFSPLRQRRFIAAVKRLEELKQEKFCPAILNMDYEPNHVLVSNERLIVVDWGDTTIGDPACDVGWAYHLLRLGGEMFGLDLGTYFVKSYEKYLGQRLVNLQFWKDVSAFKLATGFGLSPFCDSKFLNYGRLIDINFGYVFGKIREVRQLQRMQQVFFNHHSDVYHNLDNIQSYALQYLESDRYIKNT